MPNRILVSVSNDLKTDQRVRKQCLSLLEAGYQIAVVGCNKGDADTIDLPFEVKLIPVLFKTGFLFYAEWNIRLFFSLVFSPSDLFWANDLDTLPASGLASLIRGKLLVYDSHELFTEVPEIQDKPFVKTLWKFFERLFIKRCCLILTVNNSIALRLSEMYSLSGVQVVPNVPIYQDQVRPLDRYELGIPKGALLLIYQGSGINVDRGTEELIEAMAMVDNTVLIIAGGGDVIDYLKNQVTRLDLNNRVIFKDKMPYQELMQYTAMADLGLSLDKPSNLNYRFSLPNKVFDYASQGVPVLVSNLPELSSLVSKYQIGYLCEEISPNAISESIKSIAINLTEAKQYGVNGRKMIQEMNWQAKFAPALSKLTTLLGK